jgi:hypothetical protein
LRLLSKPKGLGTHFLVEAEVSVLVEQYGPLSAALRSGIGRLACEAFVLPEPKVCVEVLAVHVVGGGVDLEVLAVLVVTRVCHLVEELFTSGCEMAVLGAGCGAAGQGDGERRVPPLFTKSQERVEGLLNATTQRNKQGNIVGVVAAAAR